MYANLYNCIYTMNIYVYIYNMDEWINDAGRTCDDREEEVEEDEDERHVPHHPKEHPARREVGDVFIEIDILAAMGTARESKARRSCVNCETHVLGQHLGKKWRFLVTALVPANPAASQKTQAHVGRCSALDISHCTTRCTAILSWKVNLCHTFNIRAPCWAFLVTLRSKFRDNKTL